ncbi:hypothetical protein NOC27_2767 [Nitrosococcus oceani AFC27]|nr:hypothetical protein NOC27_2767 [Nitrosococcus oceani AFC27]
MLNLLYREESHCYGSLLDFFIALDKKDHPLRQRMLLPA